MKLTRTPYLIVFFKNFVCSYFKKKENRKASTAKINPVFIDQINQIAKINSAIYMFFKLSIAKINSTKFYACKNLCP